MEGAESVYYEKNWLEILQNPIYHSTIEKQRALEYARTNIAQITKTNEVFSLNLKAFTEVLKSDDLNVDSEIKVFELVNIWISRNESNPYDVLPQLIQVVRLAHIPTEYLIDNVLSSIWSKDGCRPYFEEAMHWMFSTSKKAYNERTRPRKYTTSNQNKPVDQKPTDDKPLDSSSKGAKIEEKTSKKLIALSSNIVEIYNANENKWQQLKNITLTKTRYSAAMMGDRLIISGGLQPNAVQTVEEIDLLTGKVTSLAPMLEYRFDHRLISVKNGNDWLLYAIGGRQDMNFAGKSTVERYNPATNTWTYVASMFSPRYGFGAVLHGNDIYVVGGYGTKGFMKVMEVYHIDQNKWEEKSKMNQRRLFNDAVISGNTLYAIAGHSWDYDENSQSNSVETYNIDTGIWYKTDSLYTTGYVGATILNDSPIVAGGWDQKNIVETYDKTTEKWKPLAPMTVARDMVNLLPLPSIYENNDFNW